MWQKQGTHIPESLKEYVSQFNQASVKSNVVSAYQGKRWLIGFPLTGLDISDDNQVAVGKFDFDGVRCEVAFFEPYPSLLALRTVRVPTAEEFETLRTPLVS